MGEVMNDDRILHIVLEGLPDAYVRTKYTLKQTKRFS